MRRPLLFEIGMEECPARFIDAAMVDLQELARQAFLAHRLQWEAMHAYATPRRLTLYVDGLATRQTDLEDKVKGPPAKAAYDEAGAPTRAAIGFAAGQGVPVESLQVEETPGGAYVVAIKREPGRPAIDVLPEILTGIVLNLRFPKSMRWGEGSLRFARPIRWLVALFGDDEVPFEIEGVTAGRSTWGHRTLADMPITLTGPDEYVERLKGEGKVMVDVEARRAEVWRQVQAVAESVGGRVEGHDELLKEVTHLLEWPTALYGSFDADFLAVPEEILTTTMKEQQKYFPVYGPDGKLMPLFVTVRNGDDTALDVVRAGNEKVLAARLQDAKFFFEEDLKVPLADRVEGLKSVLFQEQLGSVYDKVERVRRIVDRAGAALNDDQRRQLDRAAYLAKADLLTQVVYEFPELQGTMGGRYARHFGEEEEVATAIEEHYLPRHAGDRLPQSVVGALLSIADKIDTIVGCFGVGLLPTGSTDPYALRRQALGIIRIMLSHELSITLRELVDMALAEYAAIVPDHKATAAAVMEFFAGRLKNLLLEQGLRVDLVDAALGLGVDDVRAAVGRATALNRAAETDGFADQTAAFHRAANLAGKGRGDEVDPALFETDEERELWETVRALEGEVRARADAGEFEAALRSLAGVRGAVDAFFQSVLVMAKEERVRENRLALLKNVVRLFGYVADFHQIRS